MICVIWIRLSLAKCLWLWTHSHYHQIFVRYIHKIDIAANYFFPFSLFFIKKKKVCFSIFQFCTSDMYIDKRHRTISYQRMIQQYVTVEGLYLRKKHSELTTRQRLFYCWRKSKIGIKMPWGIWLSVTLKAKTKIILWKWWKGWDCFSRCSGLPSRPVTLPLHPLSERHYSPLKPLIDCSGCNYWPRPLFPFFPLVLPLFSLSSTPKCAPVCSSTLKCPPQKRLRSSSLALRRKTQPHILQTSKAAETEQPVGLTYERAKSVG